MVSFHISLTKTDRVSLFFAPYLFAKNCVWKVTENWSVTAHSSIKSLCIPFEEVGLWSIQPRPSLFSSRHRFKSPSLRYDVFIPLHPSTSDGDKSYSSYLLHAAPFFDSTVLLALFPSFQQPSSKGINVPSPSSDRTLKCTSLLVGPSHGDPGLGWVWIRMFHFPISQSWTR